LTDCWLDYWHPSATAPATNPANWSEVRLTDTSFNLEQAATRFNGDFWLGDYEGLASAGNDFAAVWAMPDGSSTSKESIFFRRAISNSTGGQSAATASAASLVLQRLSAESALAMILVGGGDDASFINEYLGGVQVPAATLSMGSAAGQAYGFTEAGTGLRANSFNGSSDGAAIDVGSKTTRNLYKLLKAMNQQAANGGLRNGDITLQKEANEQFDAVDEAWAIP
jgi:hypothetical protein